MPDQQPSPNKPSAPNPGAAGMLTPQEPEGERAASRVVIVGAMHAIDNEILKWPRGSKEERYLLKARKALTRGFGNGEDAAEELSPAMMKMYLAALLGPTAPAGGPQAPAAAATPGPRPGAMPMGPGAPMGAAPPQ